MKNNEVTILDPGLAGVAGHHLDINIKVAEELKNRGKIVKIFGSVAMTADVMQRLSFCDQVQKVFRVSPYVNCIQIDEIAGAYLNFQNQVRILSEDFQKIEATGAWIFTSLFAAQAHAAVLAKRVNKVSGCVHVGTSGPWGQDSVYWRLAALASIQNKVKLEIGVIEPELIHEYQRDLSKLITIRKLRIPYETRIGVRNKTGKIRRVGFFGHQRGEKGLKILPELCEYLVKSGIEVVIHDSSGKFKENNTKNLRVIGHVDCIEDELIKCDCVVLPYDPSEYKSKGSGILWSAICVGVPVLVPYGTSLYRWVLGFGNGVGFKSITKEDIIDGLEVLGRAFSKYEDLAVDAADCWRNENSIRGFVDDLC